MSSDPRLSQPMQLHRCPYCGSRIVHHRTGVISCRPPCHHLVKVTGCRLNPMPQELLDECDSTGNGEIEWCIESCGGVVVDQGMFDLLIEIIYGEEHESIQGHYQIYDSLDEVADDDLNAPLPDYRLLYANDVGDYLRRLQLLATTVDSNENASPPDPATSSNSSNRAPRLIRPRRNRDRKTSEEDEDELDDRT